MPAMQPPRDRSALPCVGCYLYPCSACLVAACCVCSLSLPQLCLFQAGSKTEAETEAAK
jgi:hypothetical protein|eukprot:COSAG01_NODE_1792_length_9219_cov_4.501644_9_plen_59_part_00